MLIVHCLYRLYHAVHGLQISVLVHLSHFTHLHRWVQVFHIFSLYLIIWSHRLDSQHHRCSVCVCTVHHVSMLCWEDHASIHVACVLTYSGQIEYSSTHVFIPRNEKSLSLSPFKCSGNWAYADVGMQCKIGFGFMTCDGIHMEKWRKWGGVKDTRLLL